MTGQWPQIETETLPWKSDPELRSFISKTQRRKIGSTYEASMPLLIADRSVAVPPELSARIAELLVRLSRFDTEQEARGYDLPAMFLRSESSASSQIESLTSSARNIALAGLSAEAPHNAKLIVGNIEAMRKALSLTDALSMEGILKIHAALIGQGGETFGGMIRDEQVWVGGTSYSPHGAVYVPPQPSRIRDYLDDLLLFAGRDDIDPIVKAAVVHAQFETIHPFIDGNGRTGRVLLHKILRDEEVLNHTTLPLSAGLLHDVDAYMDAIREYQQGNPVGVVERLVDALELAVVIGGLAAAKIDRVLGDWSGEFTERRGSSVYRLPGVLVEQPVVNLEYLASRLGISRRAALSLAQKACEYGVLRPWGNRKRGVFYIADEIIDVLEEISSNEGVRRVLAGKGL